MEIYTVCSRCAAFSIPGSSILSENDAEKLVRYLLKDKLLDQWECIHFDVFTSNDMILYLAYPEKAMKIRLADYALPFLGEYFTE